MAELKGPLCPAICLKVKSSSKGTYVTGIRILINLDSGRDTQWKGTECDRAWGSLRLWRGSAVSRGQSTGVYVYLNFTCVTFKI